MRLILLLFSRVTRIEMCKENDFFFNYQGIEGSVSEHWVIDLPQVFADTMEYIPMSE